MSEFSGALQVCLSQRWGTVNGDGWTAVDTLVACRQMGFNTAGRLGNFSKPGCVCLCPSMLTMQIYIKALFRNLTLSLPVKPLPCRQ